MTSQGLLPLTDKEVSDFFSALDKDNDGFVTYDELEAKLEQVHQELAPEPEKYNLNHPDRRREGFDEIETAEDGLRTSYAERDGLRDFLFRLLPENQTRMNKEQFFDQVRAWDIPSQSQTSSEKEDADADEYERRLPLGRRIRARLSVDMPKIFLLTLVIALQVAFAVLQLVRFATNVPVRSAFGAGVVIAKTASGAIYPTMAFMLLSMSRYLSTFMRQSAFTSRLVNWDVHQNFHVIMSIACLVFATVHTIGHLCGTFVDGSMESQAPKVEDVLGSEWSRPTYGKYVATIPGWTGIVCIVVFWIIFLLALPVVRRRSYELFQLSHLLMFPMIALICVHGSTAMLQKPMLGYWIAVPTLIVVLERGHRIYRGLMPMTARMELLDKETVTFTIRHRYAAKWRYSAGQYILFNVPRLSYFQWHPFTVSACNTETISVHIKTDGNWTKRLRSLPTDVDIKVGVDGPFGAPAQRFYEFDRSVIIGAGIGVTPFSAILTDFQRQLNERKDPWARKRRSRSPSPAIFHRKRRHSQSRSIDTIRSNSMTSFTLQQESRWSSRAPSIFNSTHSRNDSVPSLLLPEERPTRRNDSVPSLILPSDERRSRSPTRSAPKSFKHQKNASYTSLLSRSSVDQPRDNERPRGRSPTPLLRFNKPRKPFHTGSGSVSSITLPVSGPVSPPPLNDKENRFFETVELAEKPHQISYLGGPRRRVDFHWMVREKNSLSWFSDLLNRAYDLPNVSVGDAVTRPGTPSHSRHASRAASPHASTTNLLEKNDTLSVPTVPSFGALPSLLNPFEDLGTRDPANPRLELNINTYITATKKDISTHIFRYLLDRYRTPSIPFSALTGLKAQSSFGRPDFAKELGRYHREMVASGWTGGKVGVFFCGNPKIGRCLADKCAELTARARGDGSRVRYVFMMEVFG